MRGAHKQSIAQVDLWPGDVQFNPGLQPAYLVSLVYSGQAERAAGMADSYLRSAEALGGPAHLTIGQGKGAKAMALQATGAKAEALVLYRDAVRIIADARSRTSQDEIGVIGNRVFGHILEGYMGLLADMQGSEFASLFKESPAREAFAVSDLVRAGSVDTAMAASAARASADRSLAEAVRREQDFGNEASLLQRTLGRLLAEPPERQLTKVMADMRARLGVIEKEQSALTADILKRFPAYANLIAPKPPTIDETVRVLRAGEALLTVWVGESRTFVWAVPKSGEIAFHSAQVGSKQIDQLAGKVRRTVDPFSHGLADVPPFALDEAHQLYKLVVEPVAGALTGARHVIVSANGSLGAVPFALLPTAPASVQLNALPIYTEYRNVPWLLRRHAITQVPSVNALVTLRALPARADATQSFAGIGDPIFSKAQLANQSNSGATVAVRGGTRVELRSTGRLDQFDSAELARLAPLPDTGDEVRGVAALFGAKADTLLQVSANEKEVKGRDWRTTRVILFATHGLVPGDLNGLDQPALALTAPDVAGVDGDGLLTVEEILNLKLDADWVVLSACNTASGSAEGAEALSGLGRAFFYAGTRALLASNWPVETTSAKLLTTGIFKRQTAQATLSKAEALRATMLDLMDTGEAKDAEDKAAYSYAHPLFWAPFSLVGDGS
jgi:CHAT domain-containing protein